MQVEEKGEIKDSTSVDHNIIATIKRQQTGRFHQDSRGRHQGNSVPCPSVADQDVRFFSFFGADVIIMQGNITELPR